MKIARVALAAGLAAGFVATVAAQERQPGRQPGGGFGFGGGMFGGGGGVYAMVANNKVLQEELKVTDEQKEKLKEALKPIQDKQREMMKGINPREMTDEQRKELREKGEKLAGETKKAVEGVLKPEQTKRLTQISYQMMGVNAFTNKDVQAELKITDEQKEKIKGVMETYQKDQAELRKDMPRIQFGGQISEEDRKKFQDFQKKNEALRKETEEKVVEKLTDEQKKQWKEMQGEKFDTAKLMQGFGGRQRRDD